MSEMTIKDWSLFLDELIEQYNSGKTEEEISLKYRGKWVEWAGTITSMGLDEEYARGVTFSMGKELLPMSGDKVLRSDHIGMIVSDKDVDAWRACTVGSKVKFKAQIPKKSGPFNEVEFMQFDNNPQVVLKFGLIDGKLIEVLG